MNIMKTFGLIALLVLCFGSSSMAQDASANQYTLEITNLTGNIPSLTDVKEGKLIFNYYDNKQDIEVIYKCCKIVHLPKQGEMPAPITCCENKENDMLSCITVMDLKVGDRLFIEDIVVELNGKEVKVTGVRLKF